MSTEELGTTREQADDRFGLCPHCRNNDGYMNVGRSHWFVCDEHKTKWNPAANLMSSWREETEEHWQENADHLASYTEVEPVFSESTEELRAEERVVKCFAELCNSLAQVPDDDRCFEIIDDLSHVAEIVVRGFRAGDEEAGFGIRQILPPEKEAA